MFVVSPLVSTDCMCGLDLSGCGPKPSCQLVWLLSPTGATFENQTSQPARGVLRRLTSKSLHGGATCITHASHERFPTLSGGVKRNFLML